MRHAKPHIRARAKSHIRAALAFGWTAESMARDYAVKALEAEGYTEKQAQDAVAVSWAADFNPTDPV